MVDDGGEPDERTHQQACPEPSELRAVLIEDVVLLKLMKVRRPKSCNGQLK